MSRKINGFSETMKKGNCNIHSPGALSISSDFYETAVRSVLAALVTSGEYTSLEILDKLCVFGKIQES